MDFNIILPVLVDSAVAMGCLTVITAPFVGLYVMWRKGLFSKKP